MGILLIFMIDVEVSRSTIGGATPEQVVQYKNVSWISHEKQVNKQNSLMISA